MDRRGDVVTAMHDDDDPIARAYELLAQGAEHDRQHQLWQLERAEREFLDPPRPLPSPPAPEPDRPWMEPAERRAVMRSINRNMNRDRAMRSPPQDFSKRQIAALGAALAQERARTRQQIERIGEQCTKLDQRLAAVEHLLEARGEVARLRGELAELKAGLDAAKAAPRGAVLDLVPNPSRGAA